jgi:hypothetical protein
MNGKEMFAQLIERLSTVSLQGTELTLYHGTNFPTIGMLLKG